jgi:coproporphyrinogen III oxidase-like Fe-S oxidoreductase
MVNNLREFVSEIELHGKSVYGLTNIDQEAMGRIEFSRSIRYDAIDKEEIEFAVKDYIRKNGFVLQIMDNYLMAKMNTHHNTVMISVGKACENV